MRPQDVAEHAQASIEHIFKVFEEIDFSNDLLYADWLAQTYYYVHQVSRVLCFAAGKCDIKSNLIIHKKLLASLSEEGDHDVLAKNDLENLGYTIDDFPEKMETRNFYESIFFSIDTYGPIVLFGFFLPQEGLACSKLAGIYKKVMALFGKESTTFLEEHCILDVDHYADALKLLDSLTARELKIVRDGITRSTELFTAILVSISKGQQIYSFKSNVNIDSRITG